MGVREEEDRQFFGFAHSGRASPLPEYRARGAECRYGMRALSLVTVGWCGSLAIPKSTGTTGIPEPSTPTPDEAIRSSSPGSHASRVPG